MSEAENDDYEEELDDEGWGDQSPAFIRREIGLKKLERSFLN